MRVLLAILVGVWLVIAGTAHAQNYRLRSGDVLDVTVWQDPKLNRQIVVGPDGFVSFPLAGRFKAGGRRLRRWRMHLRRGCRNSLPRNSM